MIPIEHGLDLGIQSLLESDRLEFHAEPTHAVPKVLDVPLESRQEAEVVEHGRPKLGDDVPRRVTHLLDQPDKFSTSLLLAD